ncbi:hypothetical protein FLAV_02365 [Flavobacteriales bacterium]|nr:hypothetical protein [Flavobacteriales bacterium]MCL4817163.1 hypothetical protein [Flavobacteriales bacterium]WKZ75372.1 MAG: hypothetical protein QY303_00465 [Vicingaceae bacterium]CAG0992119.1 hypothetical protein FLAV_02365 [Flavobacteriales bacterium]
MKNQFNSFNYVLKGLAFLLLFSISSLSYALENIPKVQTESKNNCGVTDTQVIQYLNSFGYQVYSLRNERGTCNRIATTQYPNMWVIVYIDSTGICCLEEVWN